MSVEDRRRGSEASASRGALLAAAARLMEQEGYAAVTSRRIAAEAGLKPQLVHYYFRSMDDLFVALYRHVSETFISKLIEVAAEKRPLSKLWAGGDDAIKAANTKMNIEFMALANHRLAVRQAMQEYNRDYRERELAVLGRHADTLAFMSGPWTSTGIALLMEAVARLVAMDEAIGVDDGHVQLQATFTAVMDHIEAELTSTGPNRRRDNASKAMRQS